MKIWNTYKLELNQAIFEARFAQPLIVLDRNNVNNVVKNLKALFPSHSFDNQGTKLELVNPNLGLQSTIELNRFGIMYGMGVGAKPKLERFNEYYKSFLFESLTNFKEIEMFSRVGVRLIYTQKGEKEATVERITSMFTINPEQLSILGKAEGAAIKIDISEDDFKVNISINPLINQSIKVDNAKTKTTTEFSTMVDCDFYKVNVHSGTFEALADEASGFVDGKLFPFLRNFER